MNNNNKKLSLYIYIYIFKNVSFSFSLTWYTKLTKTTTEINVFKNYKDIKYTN